MKTKEFTTRVWCANSRTPSHIVNLQTLPSFMTITEQCWPLPEIYEVWHQQQMKEGKQETLVQIECNNFPFKVNHKKSLKERNSAKYCLRLSPSPLNKDWTLVYFSFQSVLVYILFFPSIHSFLRLWTPFYQKDFWQNKGVKKKFRQADTMLAEHIMGVSSMTQEKRF